MKILFVVNPISGGVNKEPFLKDASIYCEKYGIEYAIFKTSGENDEENLQKQVVEYKPDKVASVGGDGTTLFTGVALKGMGVPMGIIPMGSANGMAIELFVNKNPMTALSDLVMSNVECSLDLILVNDEHYCLHIGDIGINAQIVDKYSKDPKRGMMTYAKYFGEEIRNTKAFKYRIDTGGKEYKGETLMLGICNARKFGTGVPLNKDGNPFDGIFELVLINSVDSGNLIRAGLSVFNDNLLDKQSSEVIKCDEATIHFDEEQLLQLDGEVIGNVKEVKARILKGAISFISTNDNTYISNK